MGAALHTVYAHLAYANRSPALGGFGANWPDGADDILYFLVGLKSLPRRRRPRRWHIRCDNMDQKSYAGDGQKD